MLHAGSLARLGAAWSADLVAEAIPRPLVETRCRINGEAAPKRNLSKTGRTYTGPRLHCRLRGTAVRLLLAYTLA
jgi:hypothetical protein